MAIDILQVAIVLVLLLLLVKPVGTYMAAVFMGKRTWLDPVLNPVDNAIYKVSGIDPNQQQRWPAYVKAMLLTNLVMFVMFIVIYMIQAMLPLNPDGLGPVGPWLALNTAMSFITNTNWQNYGGENTLSYLVQMLGLTHQNYLSAATGIVLAVALIRGFARHSARTVGNFWVDVTRCTLYVLIPICIPYALFLVWQGMP